MLQAEIAGRTIPSCDSYSAVGHVMRDFHFCASEARSVLLPDYRQRSDMVLLPSSESHFWAELLSELEIHRPDLAEKETRVLVIVPGSQRSAELERALYPGLENIGGRGWSGASLHGSGRQSSTSFLLYLSRTDLEGFASRNTQLG
jgi:hypothetical protein